MTAKELLKPRFEVIADYPYSANQVGEQLQRITDHLFVVSRHGDNSSLYTIEALHVYPHLFRQLNWWEYRKIEDMPNKLTNKNGTIYRVFEWDMQNMAAYVTERKSLWIPLTAYPTEYAFYPID